MLSSVLVLLALVLMACNPAPPKKADIKFTAEKVYYDGSDLLIEGFFYNAGNAPGTGIEVDSIRVFGKQTPDQQYQFIESSSMRDSNLASRKVGPGERLPWRLRILDADRGPLAYWRVEATVLYRSQ